MSLNDLGVEILAVLGGIAALIQLRLWIRNWQDSRVDQFASIERHALKLLEQIEESRFTPAVVLGIGRSGALVGGWLAGNLGTLPIEVIDRMHQVSSDPVDYPNLQAKIDLMISIYGASAHVLVVEGAATRGNSFISFERSRRLIAPDWSCKYAVLYEVETNISHIDFAAKRLSRTPGKYPWHKRSGYKSFLRLSDKGA